jgi:hypothetical protein
MDAIYETDESFPFDKLLLLKPTQVAGGNYFIKFRMNNNPLYIQPPKCKTKESIIKGGKKIYCDLMFTNENEKFIQWMENLENYCQKYIYENREQWFETELDNHDIENSFVSPFKLYKSGKYYLVRANIPSVLGKSSLKIYDEYENEVDFETLKENNDIMTILEIQGIKCSARSFQIEIEVKQMLLLKPSNIFEKCIIKYSSNTEKPNPKDNLGKTEIVYLEKSEEPKEPENPKREEPQDSMEQYLEDSINEEHLEKIETEKIETEKIETEKIEDICEIDFNLDEIEPTETVVLKNRNDVYYKMYRDARKKAKEARDLALSSYLEAKRIKNTYMLEDIDSDSDLDEESFQMDE